MKGMIVAGIAVLALAPQPADASALLTLADDPGLPARERELLRRVARVLAGAEPTARDRAVGATLPAEVAAPDCKHFSPEHGTCVDEWPRAPDRWCAACREFMVAALVAQPPADRKSVV